MQLKVYQAPNMGAAMALVRDELGPDALILSTRPIEGGVEVTVARDPGSPPPPLPDPADGPDLHWHGVPAALHNRLEDVDLVAAIARTFKFSPLPCDIGAPPLLLVGAPGAGKTMTTARIATRLKLAGQDPLVITADGRRAGAAEQLAAFTRLLGLTLIVADAAAQLPKAIARRQENAPVVIDMPGLNPHDPADQTYLRECQAASGGTTALVLPAGLDPTDAHELAQGFKDLGATFLVATRLDQSRRLGGILAAAAAGLTLSDAGISAAVVDGFAQMTPAFIAERLCVRRASKPHPLPNHEREVEQAPLSAMAMLARPKPGSSRTKL